MALSDRDRRILTDIARRMRADDPGLAAALADGRPGRRAEDHASTLVFIFGGLLLTVGVATVSFPIVLLAAATLAAAERLGSSTRTSST